MDDKLQSLWSEYRDACPDTEPGPDFMPGLWRRIDSRRQSATSWFRRWAEVCVFAALAAALFMSTVVIPSYLREPVYEANYVDVLNAAETSADGIAVLVGDIE
ncbi:MAG: hypothetical protein ABL995_17800 [Bryobacteraceae bacterium]